MANRSYTYEVSWSFKEDGNRIIEGTQTVKSTTVPRAISKAIKELNTDPDNEGAYLDKDHEDYIRASDVMIIACQNVTKGFGA